MIFLFNSYQFPELPPIIMAIVISVISIARPMPYASSRETAKVA